MPGVRDWLGWREVGVAVGNGTRNPCDGTVLYLDCDYMTMHLPKSVEFYIKRSESYHVKFF